jgi:glyceraldehyde 3-phosphate dehydrogenase
MSKRIAINGFGRIGRMVLRAILEDSRCDDLEIVAINDLMDTKTLAHLFKYDSVHGRNSAQIDAEDNGININGKSIKVTAEKDPSNLPWKELNIDIVIESSGFFASQAGGQKHLDAGAKKVVISAPANDSDITVVLGVNQDKYNPDEHQVISNASCTTNCVAPLAKALHDKFTVKRGFMTTVHSYTNDQKILDVPHKDPRRGRAASLSMIPTSTGAAKAVGLVLPDLNGKLDGTSIRVPTPNVSLVDLVVDIEGETTKEEVNEALKAVCENEMKGIMDFETAPLVSADYNGNSASSTVDALSTKVVDKNLIKVLAWYDNEWGYSCRVRDLVLFILKKGV